MDVTRRGIKATLQRDCGRIAVCITKNSTKISGNTVFTASRRRRAEGRRPYIVYMVSYMLHVVPSILYPILCMMHGVCRILHCVISR